MVRVFSFYTGAADDAISDRDLLSMAHSRGMSRFLNNTWRRPGAKNVMQMRRAGGAFCLQMHDACSTPTRT